MASYPVSELLEVFFIIFFKSDITTVNKNVLCASVNKCITLLSRYTSKKSATGTDVYAIVLKWPTGEDLVLGAPEPDHHNTAVTLLGYPGEFGFKPGQYSGMVVKIPPIPFNKMPCKWGWVFKLVGLKNM